MKTYLLLITVCVASTFTSVWGQKTEAERARQEQEVLRQKQKNEQDLNRRVNEMRALEDANRQPIHPLFYGRSSNEEIKKIKIALAPPAQELDKYKDFLRQPKTGIFRLKPNYGCNQKYLVRVDGDCQNSLLIGEFYSFRRKDYSVEDFFDLTFKNGKLTVGGFLAQGILVSLGDVSLETVSLDSGGVKFLTDFKPETESPEVKKQFKEISQGIDFNGFHYRKSLNAMVNTAYAFRVIAYRIENKIGFRGFKSLDKTPNDERFSRLLSDKRIDLTLAFKIVRKDSDESLIVLWKELNKQKAPKIVFGKGERLIDIGH
jgi:hypothetical protein